MDYYILLFIFFLLGFIITELIKRFFLKKKINVVIRNNDGTSKTVSIYSGRDPEVDQLVKEAKSKKHGVA